MNADPGDDAVDSRQRRAKRYPVALRWKALSLQERVHLLRRHGIPVLSQRQRRHADQVVARYFPGDARRVLDRWLVRAGIGEEEFLAAVSYPGNQIGNYDSPPDWMTLSGRILDSTYLAQHQPLKAETVHLSSLLYPYQAWAREQLTEIRVGIPSDARIEWEPVAASLLDLLLEQQLGLVQRTFILEINVMRLEDRLTGDTGPDRFRSAVQQLIADPARMRKLFLNYPALLRLLSTVALQWRDNARELLQRFGADRRAIVARVLSGQDPGGMIRVDGSLSDAHDGGKAVLFLGFDSGVRLVYKPRPMQIDTAYAGLINWLNAHGLGFDLKIIPCLDCGSYGWMAFVNPDPVPDRQALERFYERLGALMAVLYVLAGTDFHSENIIASGEQPVLVDLEALLHPEAPTLDDGDKISPVVRRLYKSVFQSGLLPSWSLGDPKKVSPDISGLGNREGQAYSHKSDTIDGRGTDEVRIVRRRLPLSTHDNRPHTHDASGNPAEFESSIRLGFARTYEFLSQHQAALSAPGGAYSRFDGVRVRHVVRPTLAYATLLSRSLHPDHLRDTVHRECLFAWLDSHLADGSPLRRLVRAESECLLRGDVPKFTANTDSTSVFDGHDQVYPDYFTRCSFDMHRERMASMSDEDKAFHDLVIRLSVATLRRSGEPGATVAQPFPIPEVPLPREEFEEEAAALAHEICDAAYVEDDIVEWLGLSVTGEQQCRLGALASDVYDGIAGIMLFLAYVGSHRRDDRLLSFVQKGADTLLPVIRNPDITSGGGFVGKASVAYALLHLGVLLGRDDLIAEVGDRAEHLTEKVENDQELDVVFGAAGLIGVLLAIHHVTKNPTCLTVACRCANRLLEMSTELNGERSWLTEGAAKPLTGFSHGAAGMAWALIRLGDAIGERRYLDAGLEGFHYERGVYNPEQNNWPDYREWVGEQQDEEWLAAWCHGAPGIGLSRACLPESLIGPPERNEIDRALARILDHPIANMDCLCHGEFGNLDLVLRTAQLRNDPELYHRAACRASAAFLRRRERGRWRCGSPPDEKIWGLLTGIAGIGYGLMRVSYPDRFPSILTLQSPIAASSTT